MRFQPFITYRIFRNNDQQWSQEVRGGIRGPVSENLIFFGSAGYLWEGQTDRDRLLADVRLRHTIGPYTVQQFRYRRELTYPELDLEKSYTYTIRQTLGPYVYAQAYLKYATFEDLNNNGTGSEEWRTGLHFTFTPSSKTTIRVGGIFSQVNYDNRAAGLVNQWTAVGQVRRAFGESWESVFTYQFQTRDASLPGDSYYENLFVVTLTYYFDGQGFGRNRANRANRDADEAIRGEQPYNRNVFQNHLGY
jgi:hypothetical protein